MDKQGKLPLKKNRQIRERAQTNSGATYTIGRAPVGQTFFQGEPNLHTVQQLDPLLHLHLAKHLEEEVQGRALLVGVKGKASK